MTTLALGVLDVPYAEDVPDEMQEEIRHGKKWRRSDLIGGGPPSTGDVAEWLEKKYHIMEIFWHEKQSVIAAKLETVMARRLEDLLLGGPPVSDEGMFLEATDGIKDMFNKFIDSREMEQLGIPGVPTKAALKGKSKRFKVQRGARRASFYDTGLYETSFRAEVRT